MNTYQDTAIVLSRIDYGERDRILTLLTREHGKIPVIAKGVRAAKSKLAGGIELFSETQISITPGRGSMGTLVSSRLLHYHEAIVKDLERTRLAYSFLQTMYKMLEDTTGQEYYDVLAVGLLALGDTEFNPRVVSLWFALHVLRLSGRSPNLLAEEGESFDFDYDKQVFNAAESGRFDRNDIKLLRLCSKAARPPKLQQKSISEEKLDAFAASLLADLT